MCVEIFNPKYSYEGKNYGDEKFKFILFSAAAIILFTIFNYVFVPEFLHKYIWTPPAQKDGSLDFYFRGILNYSLTMLSLYFIFKIKPWIEIVISVYFMTRSISPRK
jgi:hypothetical protein